MYGVRGPLHSWLQTFLCNRRMRVVLDGEYSEYISVDSGVPKALYLVLSCSYVILMTYRRGSIPGPSICWRLPFYRVINTFQDHIRLQEDLDGLERWATDWGMHFNSKKCCSLSPVAHMPLLDEASNIQIQNQITCTRHYLFYEAKITIKLYSDTISLNRRLAILNIIKYPV